MIDLRSLRTIGVLSFLLSSYLNTSGQTSGCGFDTSYSVLSFNYTISGGPIENYYFEINNVSFTASRYDTIYQNQKIATILQYITSPSGWIVNGRSDYYYDSTGRLIDIFSLLRNGLLFDTVGRSSTTFDSLDRKTSEYSMYCAGGIWYPQNKTEYDYTPQSPFSRTTFYGSGTAWIPNQKFEYVYNGSLRTEVRLSTWDDLSGNWILVGQSPYSPLNLGYLAGIYLLAPSYNSYGERMSEIYYLYDTLDAVMFSHNVRSPFDTINPGNSFYDSTYVWIAGRHLISRVRYERDIAFDTSYGGYWYGIETFSYSYNYDSLGNPIQNNFGSNGAGFSYRDEAYDSLGRTIFYSYRNESQHHYHINGGEYYYTYYNSDQIDISAPFADKFIPYCKGDSTSSLLVAGGGCPPYQYQWFPNTGLSSDTILNPKIFVTDSTQYSVFFSDSFGRTDSIQLWIYPALSLPSVRIDTSCSNLLSIENGQAVSWYRDGQYLQRNDSLYVNMPGNYSFEVSGQLEFHNNPYYNRMGWCNEYSDTIQITSLAYVDTVFLDATICDNSSFMLPDSQFVYAPGQYTVLIPRINGCDSLIRITLSTPPDDTTHVNARFCRNTSYTLPDSQVVYTPGVYSVTVPGTNGCDSLVMVNLTVRPNDTTYVNALFCSNTSYTLPDSQVVYTSGTYVVRLTNQLGCDSLVITTLAHMPAYTVNNPIRLCDYGQTLPNDTTIYLYAQNGCDSVINIVYTALPEYSFFDSATICLGEYYTLQNGIQCFTPGTYTANLTTTQGCDSTFITELFVAQPTSITSLSYINDTLRVITSTPAVGYNWYVGGQLVYSGTEDYWVPLQNGYYEVEAWDATGCLSTSMGLLVASLGMNNVSGLDELIVYPVPVKDVLYISVGTYAMKKMKFVELLSMDGRSVLYSNNAIENDFELTVRGVATGCYYLKVAFRDGSVACKKIAITE